MIAVSLTTENKYNKLNILYAHINALDIFWLFPSVLEISLMQDVYVPL